MTGHPIVRRFRIRRHPRDFYPWTITDRSRPKWLKHTETHAEAIEIMNAKLRQESGRGTTYSTQTWGATR